MDEEELYDLTKSEQVKLLKNLGASTKEIKALKSAKDRVNTIITLELDETPISDEEIEKEVVIESEPEGVKQVDKKGTIEVDHEGRLYCKIIR